MFAVAQFSAILLVAHNAPAFGQRAAPTRLQFDKLDDFVSDWDKRRDGERLTVSGVPMPTKIVFKKSYKMYFFEPDDNTHLGNQFYTSSSLTRVFRPYLDSATASLRVTCTLIQWNDDFEVYRTPFATKVEGLDENGALMWTANGTPPVKLKFRL